MAKIHINNDILDLSLYPRIEVTSTCIKFFVNETSGNSVCYNKGTDLTDANFGILSTYLLSEVTNPHTNVI